MSGLGRCSSLTHDGLALADVGDGDGLRPLRVIDVEATVSNRERGGIYFKRRWPSWHVISHTWSAGLRMFSEAVSREVVEAAADGSTGSFEEILERGDLSRERSYGDLEDFLGMLRSDGVRWVWLDALCINQRDDSEKGSEIEHMGAYYQGSLGCYVAHHGVGMGFRVLDEFSGRAATDATLSQYIRNDSQAYLPRWFTRAWTFQEWALPPEVTFIVQDLDMEQLHGLAWSSRINCNYPSFESIPLLPIEGHHGRYFVKDKYFLHLAQLYSSFTKVCYSERILLYQRMMLKFQRYLPEQKMEIGINPGIDVHLIVSEISQRDASNEEDRVLSILKLLQVEGTFQVRTNRSLTEQIILLAKTLLQTGQQEILLQLCLASGDGNELQGMSWAPTLNLLKDHSRQQHFVGSLYKGFDRNWVIQTFYRGGTRVVEISEGRGSLKVETKVVHGELSISNAKKLRSRFIAELMVPGKGVITEFSVPGLEMTPPDAFGIMIDATETEWQGGVVWKGRGIRENICSKLQGVPKLSIRVWLVCVGHAKLMQPTLTRTWRHMTYFLVCMDDNSDSSSTQDGREPCLHKVGYFGIPRSMAVQLHHSTPVRNVIIDGFGGDLTHLLPL